MQCSHCAATTSIGSMRCMVGIDFSGYGHLDCITVRRRTPRKDIFQQSLEFEIGIMPWSMFAVVHWKICLLS